MTLNLCNPGKWVWERLAGVQGRLQWHTFTSCPTMKPAMHRTILAEATATYQPKIGGIHPREVAQHHATHIASVIRNAIKSAGDAQIDGIAFSQGPGMGSCLRTVATAARALALSLDVPLIGVNHCVAHLKIGRWQCGIDDSLYVPKN
jgi:tRNA A37 threonylcarbamoyltransferase TsaD